MFLNIYRLLQIILNIHLKNIDFYFLIINHNFFFRYLDYYFKINNNIMIFYLIYILNNNF